MPFIPVADAIKATITFENAQGNQAQNVLFFQDEAAGAPATRLALLQAEIIDWLTASWDTVANADWSAVALDLRYMNDEDDFYLSDALDIPGLLTGDSLPSEVTIAISLRTGRTGRSYRGRLYHVGLGEDNVVGDLISDGYRTNLIAAYASLIADPQVHDFYWGVASFYTNGAARPSGVLTPYTQVTIVDRIVDSQRKRKPRAT